MRRAFVVSLVVAALTSGACGGGDAPRVVFVPPERMDAAVADAAVVAEVAVPDASPVSEAPELADPEPPFAVDPTLRHPTSVAVSFIALRAHPELARVGPILAKHPVAADATAAGLDVLRDVDSFVAYGPSLAETDRTFALMRYHVADKTVDSAVAAAAAKVLARPHGPWDAGVGVPATLGFNLDAPRVFVRPRSHLLAVFPQQLAEGELRVLEKTPAKAPPAGEAIRMRFHQPKRHITLPAAKALMPETLDELRLWAVPDPAAGADLYVEGDCTTDAAAKELAVAWTDALRSWNSLAVRIGTRGALNNVAFRADKRKVSTHVVLTQEQVAAIVNLVAAATNATLPPRGDAGP